MRVTVRSMRIDREKVSFSPLEAGRREREGKM
jgi:hypothetical protein